MIGNNVKIDILCHIAHNVVIEDNVNVFALLMIAGSDHLKETSHLASTDPVRNQLSIGRKIRLDLGKVFVEDVENNAIVADDSAKVINRSGNQ